MSDSPGADGRILYAITHDISAMFLRGQLSYLVEHGWEVHAAVRRSEPPAPFDPPVIVHHVAYEREPRPIADVRALVRTVQLVRAVRPAIVNASTPKAGLLGTVAAWLCRVPTRVYVVRGLRFETTDGLRRRAYRWLERLTSACATHVVFNSASLREVAEREGVVRRGRGLVLGAGSGNGIDVERFERRPDRRAARTALGLRTEGPVIGFVGRLTRDKGVVDLVDAFERLHLDATLLLVGDFEAGDPVPAQVEHRIRESPSMIHVPWTDDAPTVYAAIDVLAFPSYREGLPNAPLEAQLCGVPVVGYAATGTIDAVAEGVGGVLVPVGDVEALRRALLETLTSDLGERLGRSGPAWARDRFESTRVWAALEELYAGSVARPPARK